MESNQHEPAEADIGILHPERFDTMQEFQAMCFGNCGGLAGFRRFVRSNYQSPADAFAQLGSHDDGSIPLEELKIEIMHAMGSGSHLQTLRAIDAHLARD